MDPCAKPDPGQASHHSGEGQCASTWRNLPSQGLALMVSNLLFWEDVQALNAQDLEGLEMPVGDGSVFYRCVEQ